MDSREKKLTILYAIFVGVDLLFIVLFVASVVTLFDIYTSLSRTQIYDVFLKSLLPYMSLMYAFALPSQLTHWLKLNNVNKSLLRIYGTFAGITICLGILWLWNTFGELYVLVLSSATNFYVIFLNPYCILFLLSNIPTGYYITRLKKWRLQKQIRNNFKPREQVQAARGAPVM